MALLRRFPINIQPASSLPQNRRPMASALPSPSTSAEPPSSSNQHSTLPIEMNTITTSDKTSTPSAGSQGLLNDISIPVTSPITSDFATSSSVPAATSKMSADHAKENSRPGEQASSNAAISTQSKDYDPLSQSTPDNAAASATSSAPDPAITSQDSAAIGASTDQLHSHASASDSEPVLVITLLLGSGARHPYKIDEKYLTKRNVTVPDMTEGGRKDPFSISVYTLKELILREWREEWEQQPSSPSSIRLIFFGRLLDDKIALRGKTITCFTLSILSCLFFFGFDLFVGGCILHSRSGEERMLIRGNRLQIQCRNTKRRTHDSPPTRYR